MRRLIFGAILIAVAAAGSHVDLVLTCCSSDARAANILERFAAVAQAP